MAKAAAGKENSGAVVWVGTAGVTGRWWGVVRGVVGTLVVGTLVVGTMVVGRVVARKVWGVGRRAWRVGRLYS